ncbi:MAG TPA: hypothetical protein VEB21_08960 [Terriglobales bacterium]|nr:hypothetical protein [Terriglobales bacterium]
MKVGSLLRWLAIAVLAAIAAGEIGLRVVPRSIVPQLRLLDRVYGARSAWTQMMTGDPYLGYKLKPGLDIDFPSEGRRIPFRTNSYGLDGIGFRDLGNQPPFRMVAVGGSFTVCDDVPAEACWVRRLADSLNSSAVTLAANGYSTLAAARTLARYGSHFGGKLVLVEVHPNDFRDNATFERWSRTGDDNFWEWLAFQRGRTPWVQWLGRNSMIFRLIDGSSRGLHRLIYSYNQDGLDLVFRLDTWFLSVVRNGERHAGWPLTQLSLQQLRNTARSQGAEMMAVLFPTKEQAYWQRVKPMAPADIAPIIDRPIELVADYCRQQGLHCCDLRPALRQHAATTEQIFHRISAHPNDLGHAVVAEAVEECLRDQALIDQIQNEPPGGPPA